MRAIFWSGALIFVLAGCGASQQQILADKQPTAIQAATSRAQFELGCDSVSASVPSSEVMQPAIQGPFVQGPQRAEYTIGVTGCGKKAEYITVCAEGGTGCIAARRDMPARP